MSHVYASHATWCAWCHNPPALCRCERDSVGAVDLLRILDADPPASTIAGQRITANDPLTPFCSCGKPLRECGGACQQRLALIVQTDGYLRHAGHIYAVTMEVE